MIKDVQLNIFLNEFSLLALYFNIKILIFVKNIYIHYCNFISRAPSRRRNPGSSRLRTPRPPSIINPYNTPEPPTTPAAVKGFQCKREGFQPDPEDCHKYYWCLNSGASGLGIVPHAFTCPSDLLFDKKIDGCNQPSNVKCKVQPNRGGSNVTPPTTTAIPRTTEFDESLLPSYDYLYEDYYLDDPALVEAIDETIATIPEKETTIVRNSGGGNQFQNARTNDINEEIPIVNEEISVVNEEIPSQNLGGGRSRPQYTSIQRDRPKVTESNTETEIVDELPIESPVHGNRPSRPQYTTLNRQRPAAHAVEEPEQVIDSSTDRGGLNYVTINRGRPAPTEPSLLESTTADDRLEYVTIKRSRPATTEASVDYISLLDYYDEELEAVTIPSTTSTTTEPTTTEPTTTTEPPKIRIPTGRPTPPRRVPGNFNIRRRFRGRSTTTTTTTEESLVDETLNLFNTENTTPNSIARPQRPQRPTRPASTLVRPTGAPRRRIPSPIRRRPQRPSVQRREQLAREKQLAAEEAIKKEKVLEQELEAALAEELEAALAEELETAPTEAPLEETFIQSAEPKEVPLEDKPFIVEDVIEPKEVPFEDKPLIVEDVIEPKEVAQDVSEKEKVEAITPEEATPVDNVFDLFNQQQSEVQTDAPELVADKARPVILEEAVTSLPPVEEAIVEDKIETATIPADVEKPTTTTSARPRTRRPIPFRPNLRPRPVSTPIETEVKEEKSEGRDISSVPSFTDILSGSRRNPPIGPRPVIVPESVLVATESPIVDDKPSTTIRSIPVVSSARPKLTTRLIPTSQPKRRPPQPRTTTTAQPIEYEYVYDYYDGQDGALGGSLGKLASLTEKAILLPDGSVECYDTGYFPHPESCKKFISCSKTVRGFLRGWTYTCPQELVFDPVGGMCNWTEAVDCRTNL